MLTLDLLALLQKGSGSNIGLPKRIGQIAFSSSSVAAVHCCDVIVPAGACTAKWALSHWSGSLVVDPGSVQVPATHWDVAGALVAQFEAQVVVVEPGSHAPATVDPLDELAVLVAEPPALPPLDPLPAAAPLDVLPALEPPLRLPDAPLVGAPELIALRGLARSAGAAGRHPQQSRDWQAFNAAAHLPSHEKTTALDARSMGQSDRAREARLRNVPLPRGRDEF